MQKIVTKYLIAFVLLLFAGQFSILYAGDGGVHSLKSNTSYQSPLDGSGDIDHISASAAINTNSGKIASALEVPFFENEENEEEEENNKANTSKKNSRNANNAAENINLESGYFYNPGSLHSFYNYLSHTTSERYLVFGVFRI